MENKELNVLMHTTGDFRVQMNDSGIPGLLHQQSEAVSSSGSQVRQLGEEAKLYDPASYTLPGRVPL